MVKNQICFFSGYRGAQFILTLGSVEFTWGDNTSESNASSTAKVMILTYNSTKGEAIFVTDEAARSTGYQSLTVPDDFSGDSVECFIVFIYEDGLSVANSKYVGSVTVA